MKRHVVSAAMFAVASMWGSFTWSAPYASAITEAGGNVTFRLNEPADEVIVVRDGVPQSLGALSAGSHTFARSGAAVYEINVRTAAPNGYRNFSSLIATPLQTSDSNNSLLSFAGPRGVVVNQNPANGALFGRVYVSDIGGVTPLRTTTKGIYVLNPDLTDALGQGNISLTGGIAFQTGNGFSPWRLALDNSGKLIISDQSDGAGSVYLTSADVTSGVDLLVGSGPYTFGIIPDPTRNHGSVAAVHVQGTHGSNLTLFTIDEDMDPTGVGNQLNSWWRYDVGATLSGYNGIPTQGARPLISNFTPGGISVDLDRGQNGFFYMTQSRTDGNEVGVAVVSADGQTVLYDSLQDSIARNLDGNPAVPAIQDMLRQTHGIDVSEDGRILAIATRPSDIRLVPLLAGIPDITHIVELDAFPNVVLGRDIAFDAAGNLHMISSGNQAMRVFAPGGNSITSYSSAGTFVADPSYTAGAGNYSSSVNWRAGVVPNGLSQVAAFTGAGGNVNVDVPITLDAIKFNSASSYTLSGSHAITMEGLSPHIMAQLGSHTVSAPVSLLQNSAFVADAGATLTVTDLSVSSSAPAPVEVYTGGSGLVALNKVVAQRLQVVAGTTRILPNGTVSSTSNVKELRLTGESAPTVKLDITNNAFVVDYTGDSPLNIIRSQIISGYAGGAWTGNGINSSSAAGGSTHGIGYAEASALLSVPAIFAGADATSVLFRYTRYGDANLDGTIGLPDFNRLAASFGATGANWDQGDFNYDGVVSLPDFNRLAGNFGLSAGPNGPTPEDWAALASVVPEPSTLLLTGVGATALRRRRHPSACRQR